MNKELEAALKIITRHASQAEGERSFGHLRLKPADKSLGIEDGEELGEGELHGHPGKVPTPGAELNSKVQDHVLGKQDHQLPDTGDEYPMPGAMPAEPDADEFGGPSDDDEDNKKPAMLGFMSTNPKHLRAPEVASLAEPKRRRGRPRGSK